jgi:D-alanyl-D-alanine dipeptidase
MFRLRTRALPLLLLVACAGTVTIPTNRYGLQVVPDLATFERLVREDPSKRLVNVATFGIATDVRYATPNNFMHQTLYSIPKAYLRVQAAVALADVKDELRARGLALKVFDAYRPYEITELMWEPIKNPDFVADPAKGSRHNRGAAVDVTLINLDGVELAMPTPYDDFTPRARHDFNDLPAEVLANRALLRDVMVKHGFEPLPSEWWHYDFKNWDRFELMNVPLEALEAHEASQPVPIPW